MINLYDITKPNWSMNKKLLCILFFLLCNLNPLLAQPPLTGSPTTTIEESGNLMEFDIVVEAYVHNNTPKSMKVKWRRVTSELPPTWKNRVCDPISCWESSISTNPQTLVIPPNSSMLLDAHFQPNEVEGNGMVEIVVWAVADSSNTNIKMTYKANAYTVKNNDSPESQIKVYPNPVNEHLTIDIGSETTARYVEVYSLIGRKMAHYAVPSNVGKYKVNASALPEGLYFVKMLNKNYEQIATRSFAKD